MIIPRVMMNFSVLYQDLQQRRCLLDICACILLTTHLIDNCYFRKSFSDSCSLICFSFFFSSSLNLGCNFTSLATVKHVPNNPKPWQTISLSSSALPSPRRRMIWDQENFCFPSDKAYDPTGPCVTVYGNSKYLAALTPLRTLRSFAFQVYSKTH